MHKILVVDDEKDALDFLAEMIRFEGFEAIVAANANDGILQLEKHASSIILILSDANMPIIGGLEFRKKTIEKFKDIPFAIVSGNVTHEMALYALEYNICGFLDKPITQNQLKELIQKKATDRITFLEEKIILRQTFIEESTSIISELEPLILSLESNPNNLQVINTIFRLVHTVKGASGILDDHSIRNYLHKFEDLLSKIKSIEILPTEEVVSVLLKGYDTMQQMIKNLSSETQKIFNVEELIKIFEINSAKQSEDKFKKIDEPKEKIDDQNINSKKENKINVTSDLLDELLEKSGETTVLRNMINKIVISIGKEIPSHGGISLLASLLDEMHKINSITQSKIANLRKVPLKNILRPIPRVIRETSRALGKKVNLHVENIDLLLETSIGQAFSESIIHIIRNAIDHGIEHEEARVKIGKPKEGSIKIITKEENGFIYMDICDDGKGINPQFIRDKIIEKNLISKEDALHLSQSQIFSFIFHSGFSTAEKITDISGRGVGMDMVRSSIESKGGSILIDSHVGKGTTFKIKIPIPKSVIIINSILVKIGQEVFAVPQNEVDRIFHVDESKVDKVIKAVGSSTMIIYDGQLVPIIDLHKVFNLDVDKNKIHKDFLIISQDDRKYALFVSSIIDTEEVVVKDVIHLRKYPSYKGATFTGDGRVALILNTDFFISNDSGIKTQRNFFSKSDSLIFEQTQRESFVVFKSEDGTRYAIFLDNIFRLEFFDEKNIKESMGKKSIIYRDKILNLFHVDDLFKKSKKEKDTKKYDVHTIVIQHENNLIGMVVDEIIEIKEDKISYKDINTSSKFVKGYMVINEKITNFLDIEEILSYKNMYVKKVLNEEHKKLPENPSFDPNLKMGFF